MRFDYYFLFDFILLVSCRAEGLCQHVSVLDYRPASKNYSLVAGSSLPGRLFLHVDNNHALFYMLWWHIIFYYLLENLL